ncbi:autotransporter assembly complex family protein [Erythrobacter sp. 3-20A1M]|uniref:autotransporter assembly complex protein TamA n=1 Tax=Erythrobacter sp. 3-20A1M TaxID=2653850 RepID=UPI00203AA569|nr:BamA/TamA family outer membrane protein [Erythrobacter sp. 3-20A1M]
MAELPDMGIEWPDTLELPPLERLEPDEDAAQFAAPELEGEDLAAGLVEERLSDQLVLAFPADETAFPLRQEFIERYKALSTIEEYGSKDANIAQLAARAKKDTELLDQILRNYGYYDSQVQRTVSTVPAADGEATRPQVRFDIVPGPRYRFGSIDLGQLASAPDGDYLRSAFEIQSGDPLSNDAIVDEQFDLDTALGEAGYAFAEIDSPSLLIDHEETIGDLSMAVRPMGKYRFGAVTSSEPEFLSGRHLADIARFDPGDIYQRSLQLDLRRAITATGLVSSVTVTPREVEAPSGNEPGVVDLDVSLRKARLRTIAGAIGYGSEDGIRLEASWEHRNLFPPEGALRVRGIAGTQEQLFGVTFRKNNFGERDRILNIDAYASTLNNPAFDANTVSLVGTLGKVSNLLFQKPFSWSAGLELVATDERPADSSQPRQTYLIAALPLYAQIDTSDDLLDPEHGFRVALKLSPEVSRTNGAESFYLRGRLDTSYYYSVNDRIVVAGRTAYGSIVGADLFDIAPSRRYYAGGGGSVRGYGYRTIGPRDAEGDPTGGRSVVEGAIEARIRTGLFGGAVSVVPFIDAGSVSTSTVPDFDSVKIGAGVGVRYATGFGPIRLDVGVPINPGPDDSPVAVYVSLGQAF